MLYDCSIFVRVSYEYSPTKEDEDYSTNQNEKDQEKVNCTCFKLYDEGNDRILQETRLAQGCMEKQMMTRRRRPR